MVDDNTLDGGNYSDYNQIKDNIHTTDLPTTAGTLSLDGFIPPYEATLVENLRASGAVIIAKTVMTEMAHWMIFLSACPTRNSFCASSIGLNAQQYGIFFVVYEPMHCPVSVSQSLQ